MLWSMSIVCGEMYNKEQANKGTKNKGAKNKEQRSKGAKNKEQRSKRTGCPLGAQANKEPADLWAHKEQKSVSKNK